MTNPFDDPDGRFLALRNAEGRYSIWPAYLTVPEGWSVEHGEDDRAACLQVISQRWTDAATVGVGPSHTG